MKTSEQQIMARRVQGLRPERSRRPAGLQVLLAVLMLLVGGGNSCMGAIVHY